MINDINARIIFADSRQLDKLLPKNSIDLILSGPPYWNEVIYSSDDAQLSRISSYPDFLSEISKCWTACSAVLKDGSILAIWVHDLLRKVGNKYQYIPFHSDIIKTFPKDITLKNIYIWDRYLNKDGGDIQDSQFGTRVQYILIFQKDGNMDNPNSQKIVKALQGLYWQPVWHKKTMPRLLGSKWLFRACTSIVKPFSQHLSGFGARIKKLGILEDDYTFSNYYMTECPRDVSDLLIDLFSSPGDVVLDPFVGSGTTLKSALDLKRQCIGIEINKSSMLAIKKKLGSKAIFL